MIRIFFLLIISLSSALYALGDDDQPQYAVDHIAADLKENSFAVIRHHSTRIDIVKPGRARITEEVVITILKDEARELEFFSDAYDRFSKIVSLEGYAYDNHGKFIRRIKNK